MTVLPRRGMLVVEELVGLEEMLMGQERRQYVQVYLSRALVYGEHGNFL